MIVKQRVRDLADSQAAFDGLRAARESYGVHDIGRYRTADEADTVIVITEDEGFARARECGHSGVLAGGRRKARAVGALPAGADQVRLADCPVGGDRGGA
jgi:hypothetical protein